MLTTDKKSGTKVAVIGAGSVGASIAFAMSINQLCSDLVLIDVNRDKAIGEAMDINHGLPFLGQMRVRAGEYSDCRDCDVIIITAGIPRKPGETRLDLARKNVILGKSIVDGFMPYYTTGVILVVSNPVDVMTYMISKWTNLPFGRVIGSGTVLDSARFRYLLSQKMGIDVRNVHGYIIGEHGDSQLPAWSATNIAGLSIDDYCRTTGITFDDHDRLEIAEHVRKAGADIIKTKGATFYAIAIAVNTIVESILKGASTIRTVGTVMNGAYGLRDVVVNVPSVLGASGVERVLELELTDQEKRFLTFSADQVRQVIDQISEKQS
ncbi:MAG: L-lactate dehydrogenase [Clostridiaceae bacterium]|nr:L-lactate dehydrogenase [Clostridiaceae bacterium]